MSVLDPTIGYIGLQPLACKHIFFLLFHLPFTTTIGGDSFTEKRLKIQMA